MVADSRVEVCHQRRNVLCGCQPLVQKVAHVEEAAGGDGDLAHAVTVERERERRLDRLKYKEQQP